MITVHAIQRCKQRYKIQIDGKGVADIIKQIQGGKSKRLLVRIGSKSAGEIHQILLRGKPAVVTVNLARDRIITFPPPRKYRRAGRNDSVKGRPQRKFDDREDRND